MNGLGVELALASTLKWMEINGKFGKDELLEMLRNHFVTNDWMGPGNIDCRKRYIP